MREEMGINNGLGLEITELRLGLPGGGAIRQEKKRVHSDVEEDRGQKRKISISGRGDKPQTLAKNQAAVGWPPVCSYRRRNSLTDHVEKSTKVYVKVCMDGAPFLRKINLSVQKGYSELGMNLEKLFRSCFGVGEELNDVDSSEYVPIYEDKDGDWMLVGDVPWTMFVESCKKLRIMKKTEAKGIGLLCAKSSFQ